MSTDMGWVPGGAVRFVAGSSPRPNAKAIAQAATSARCDSGSTTRQICAPGPIPSRAAASRYSWGNARRKGQSNNSAYGSALSVSAITIIAGES